MGKSDEEIGLLVREREHCMNCERMSLSVTRIRDKMQKNDWAGAIEFSD
jgi:hypothetical protein